MSFSCSEVLNFIGLVIFGAVLGGIGMYLVDPSSLSVYEIIPLLVGSLIGVLFWKTLLGKKVTEFIKKN